MKIKLFTFFALMIVTFACEDDDAQRPKIYVGDVRLAHQEDVNEWAKNDFEEVVGDLHLGGCRTCHIEDQFRSTIEDISALKNLKRISGSLTIFAATELETLHDLDSLSILGGLLIDDCDLTSYDALNRLDSVYGDLSLETSSAITNLDSFNRLTYVKGRLRNSYTS